MEFKDNSNNIKMDIEKASKAGIVAASEVILSQSKNLTPIDTSKLHDEQFYQINGLESQIGSPTEYAEEVEDRTPYLTPSFRATKEDVKKLIAYYLRSEVK